MTHEKSLIEGDIVGIEFNPNVFQSQAMALYLHNRISDYLNDPEPQEDKFCESIPKDYLTELMTYLNGSLNLYRAKNED